MKVLGPIRPAGFVQTPEPAPVDRPVIDAFHIMTKPIGPICNLDCKYCFYLEKEALYPDTRKWAMPDDALEAYISKYIAEQSAPEVTFAWQGGEPTLLGVRYFEKVVALQQKYANGKVIHNALQTNGTLLDDAWCEFFARNQFLIGLSIDGPKHIHDMYRVDKQGRSSFDDVMRGLSFLKKHKVEFNTLTVVHRHLAKRPLEVYQFLKDIGSNYIQFIPLVERALPGSESSSVASAPIALTVSGKPSQLGRYNKGFDFAEPPLLGQHHNHQDHQADSPVTEWTVNPQDYGQFLCIIYDHWVRNDVGRTFVQMFDVALGIWMGLGASLCVFAEKCGTAMALEHNGDLYSCDHYVYPRYKLGNVLNHSIKAMVESAQQRQFGSDKSDTLPNFCKQCDVRFACQGECPKHRFTNTPDGQPGLNYLCAAYKQFFTHIDPTMRQMAQYVHSGRPADLIMSQTRPAPRWAATASVGRNDPCPCGSGNKFKKCCGAGGAG